MRVNVSKAYISKTFMSGLKVLNKFSNKSNKKKSLEFDLKSIQVLKQTLAAPSVSLAVATFATALLVLSVNLLLDIVGVCSLTVLMNDFRLKTFYCPLTKQPKSSNTKATKKTTSPPTALSSPSAASSSTTTTSSNNNNHNRTYNNSSKSNKVFLYYTPRDPRLRIFSKTKHLSNRPKLHSQSHLNQTISFSNSCAAAALKNNNNNSSLKISNCLCNCGSGELIGGSGVNRSDIDIIQNINKNNNTNNRNRCSCSSKNKNCVAKTTETIVLVCKTNLKLNSVNSSKFNKTTTICDNLTKKKTSDNRRVVAAAAVISTSSASAEAAAVTEDLVHFIGILLSFFNHHWPQLKKFSETTIFGITKNIIL